MWQSFCRWLLLKRMGWTINTTQQLSDKFIICLAPHTSNWDFVIGQLYSGAIGLRCNFLMKKEWFFFPMGYIFKKLGGIPVFRGKHTSMTDNLAATAVKMKTFRLCITPEGTRKPNPEWKKGFYFIAQKAGIPVLLYGVDYRRKLIQCTETFIPTGNVDEDMKRIKEYFKDFCGKHPENFAL